MFDTMWDEIQDMQGEIFDVCENTGMLLYPGQEPYTEEEIDSLQKTFDLDEEEFWDQFDEGWNSAKEEKWQEVYA
jgi:uncharacterized damage-inducible protein DinB